MGLPLNDILHQRSDVTLSAGTNFNKVLRRTSTEPSSSRYTVEKTMPIRLASSGLDKPVAYRYGLPAGCAGGRRALFRRIRHSVKVSRLTFHKRSRPRTQAVNAAAKRTILWANALFAKTNTTAIGASARGVEAMQVVADGLPSDQASSRVHDFAYRKGHQWQ